MQPKYNTSVCLLIKDENDYINEWLKWHISIGFDHFFIYDNRSKVPIEETVDTMYRSYCTFIDYSSGYNCLQVDCYNHALKNFGSETKWMAFIDTDEFIRVTDGQNINEFLRDYETHDGLYVRWILYNANGLRHKDTRPQRERFTQQVPYERQLPCGKSIIQPAKVKTMGTHFPCGTMGQYDMVDSDGNYLRVGGIRKFSPNDKIVIDHYFTRSLEEWHEKAARGSCDPRVYRNYDEFYLYNPDMIESN